MDGQRVLKPQPKEMPFRSRKYLMHIRNMPCIECGWPFSEPHHIETGGMATKCGDNLVVPLCGLNARGCHRKADKSPESAEKYQPIAERLFAEWRGRD